jgi:hypothetical protein
VHSASHTNFSDDERVRMSCIGEVLFRGKLMPLSYEGWQRDVKDAERLHCENSCCLGVRALDNMRRKQEVHDGDRSHVTIRELDAFTPSLFYSGWESDRVARGDRLVRHGRR